MCNQTNSEGTHRCICSPGSGAGALRSEWPDGPTTDQSGPEAAPASRFPLPAKEPVQMTLGTFGLTCDDWLQSADPQSCSENKSPAPQLSERLGARLMERLARFGSMEYSLTWKRRVTPAGRLFYQQRASGRRTSGRDCGGWPTATAVDRVRDEETLQKCADFRKRNANQNTVPLYLGEVAQFAVWPTPDANAFEAKDLTRLQERCEECKERTGNGNGFGVALGQAARLVSSGWPTARAEDSESTGAHRGSPDTLTSAAQVSGWPTPRTPTGGAESAERKQELGRTESGGSDLGAVATMAGWCTPNAMDGGQTSRGGDRIGEALLAGQAQAAGWATPQARDHFPPHSEEYVAEKRDQGHGMRNLSDEALTGATPGSPAQTGPRGVLNPQFPLWLMGYPEAWATCAPGHQGWETVQEAFSRRPDGSARALCEGQATP